MNRIVKNIIVSLALCSSIGLTSCLDLDPVIYDKISPENFFQSEDDAKAAVTAIYNPFRPDWNGSIYSAGMGTYLTLSNLPSDDTGLTRSDWEIPDRFLWNSTTSWVTDLYNPLLKYVSRATLLMYYLDKSPIREEVKARYMAEVQCARAQYMFILYDLYGSGGVVLDPTILLSPEEDVYLERPSQPDFAKLIETDLLAASKELPETYAPTDWGRFTKGAALTILQKLYMQEKNWEAAEKVGREIMTLGYTLQPSYKSIFTVENEMNDEIIWAVPCKAEGGNGNMWMTHVLCPDYPVNNSNIQRWYVYITPWDFYEKYEDGDDRKTLNVSEFYYTPAGATEPILATKENFIHMQYGALPLKYPEDPNQTSEMAGNDMVIYRYADVLLAQAEVLNELNGPTAEAIALVEQVRSRAHLVNSIPASATASKDAFRDFILDERGRELFVEGHRRRDLIRHGKFIEVAHKQGHEAAKDFMVLFPIPQNAIDDSKGMVKQNPGY